MQLKQIKVKNSHKVANLVSKKAIEISKINDLESSNFEEEISEWEKELLFKRLEQLKNPKELISSEEFMEELNRKI